MLDPATGRRVILGVFATKDDADRAIAVATAEQLAGNWVDPRRGRLTLATWINQHWWPSKQHLRPTTLSAYRYVVDHVILPHLGAVTLSRLDPPAIARWRSRLLAQGDLSSATVAKAYRTLRQALDAAVEARYLAVNPAKLRGAAAEPKTDLVVPTIDEALALAAAMPDRLRLLVLLYGFAGLRLGELQALRRRHIDLVHRTVRVEEAVSEVNGKIIVGPPKTDAGVRVVDLPSIVVAALDDHLDRFVAADPNGLVFPDRVGGYQRRRTVRAHWAKARTQVGLPGVRLHDLRHLAGTLGTLSGATTKEQMARLGHASSAAALRYQHVVEGRGKAIATGIDRLVEEAAEAKRADLRQLPTDRP